MLSEIAQWVTPAIVVAVLVYMRRSMRQDMKQLETRLREDMKQLQTRLREDMKQLQTRLREDMKELRGEVVNLRDRMDSQHGDHRDRMGRIEGTLDVLREFFVRTGRGTAA
jgi:predicted nuclease with TOPRIM domain